MAEIVRNLSFKEYQLSEGISNSMLSKIGISPLHFKEYIDNPPKKTDSFIFGSLLHCLVLEPDNFDRDFITEPIVNKRTNEGKAILEEFYLMNTIYNKTIVTEEQINTAMILKEKIYQHPFAKKLLTGKGETEISLFWEDEEVKCKGRPDRIHNKIIIDLKTTTSAKPEDFIKNAYKYGYHRQACWYSTGYEKCFKEKPKGFVFIAVEKEPPYAVAVFEATELLKEIGKIEARQNLLTYKECMAKGEFWGYDGAKPKIHSLDPPEWVLNKFAEEIDLGEDFGE